LASFLSANLASAIASYVCWLSGSATIASFNFLSFSKLAISFEARATVFLFLSASALSVSTSTSLLSLAFYSSSGKSPGSAFKADSFALTSAFKSLYSSIVSGVGVLAISSSVGSFGGATSAAFLIVSSTFLTSSFALAAAAVALASATLVASVSGAASSTTDGSAAVTPSSYD